MNIILDVRFESIVALATVTDPQGTANLLDVEQGIKVFPDLQCQGEPIFLRDDLAGSGVEESFGTVALAGSPLYATIGREIGWPVEVLFRDAEGNLTFEAGPHQGFSGDPEAIARLCAALA